MRSGIAKIDVPNKAWPSDHEERRVLARLAPSDAQLAERYFDGQLDVVEADQLERRAAADPPLAALLETVWEDRLATRGLRAWSPRPADDCLSDRTLWQFAHGQLAREDRARVFEHLTRNCARCARSVALLRPDAKNGRTWSALLTFAAAAAVVLVAVLPSAWLQPRVQARGDAGLADRVRLELFVANERPVPITEGRTLTPETPIGLSYVNLVRDRPVYLAVAVVDSAETITWLVPDRGPTLPELRRNAAEDPRFDDLFILSLTPGPATVRWGFFDASHSLEALERDEDWASAFKKGRLDLVVQPAR